MLSLINITNLDCTIICRFGRLGNA
jgi:hypothetical protein